MSIDLTTLQTQRQLKRYAATLIRQMADDPFRGTALLLTATAIAESVIATPPPETLGYAHTRAVLLSTAEKLEQSGS